VVRVHRLGPVTQLRLTRTAFGRPLFWVCAHYVDGLLIGTGCAHTAEEFTAALGEFPVAQVVNTHHHEDHAGGNVSVAARVGHTVRIHRAGIDRLRHSDQRLLLYRRVVWGAPAPYDPQPLGEQIVTDHYAFHVIHVPGYSLDQVVLFEERMGWVFSADLYLGERVKYLRRDERLGESLSSLRRVAALPFEWLFCSHSGVVRGGQQALRAKLAYWETVCRLVEALRAAGRSPAQIHREVLGTEGALRWISGGDFAKQHLVDEAMKLVTARRQLDAGAA